MKELWQTLFSIRVDRTFLKVFAKILVKVARIGEVVSRRGPAILTKRASNIIKYNFTHGQH